MSSLKSYSLGTEQLAALGLPHLRMFGHSTILNSAKFWLAQHLNDGVEICYIIKGRFEWKIEGSRVVLYPGDFTFTFPWQRHGGANDSMDVGELVWIIINPASFTPNSPLRLGKWSNIPKAQQVWIGDALLKAQTQYFAGDDYLKLLFRQFEAEIVASRPWQASRLNRLMDEIFTCVANQASQSRLIRKNAFSLEIIHKKLSADLRREWNIRDMEKMTGYSKSMLNQLLREHTGYSTMAYLTSLRIEKAKQILANSNKKLGDIAWECGFRNSQQFSAIFKKYAGKTPSDFRRGTLLKPVDNVSRSKKH